MTRTASKRRQQKRKHVAPKAKPRKKTSDQAIYLVVLLVGFFGVMIASLFAGLNYWPVFTFVYLVFIAYAVNMSAFQVYRGQHVQSWQYAMARVPLRLAGYGTKAGKPLEAAHGHPETFRAFLISLVISLVALAVIGYFAFR